MYVDEGTCNFLQEGGQRAAPTDAIHQRALNQAAQTTSQIRQKASDAVKGLGEGCQGVVNDPKNNIGTATLAQALAFNATDASYYNTFGDQGTLKLSETERTQFSPDPTLADFAPPDAGAFVVGGRSIYLNASFYTGTANWQAAALVHELLHLSFGGETDVERAQRFGINVPNAASLSGNALLHAASSATQDWLLKDCGRLP
jgi:hypothetical protein